MNQSEICRYLRTKKMFIPALADGAKDCSGDEPGHSPHCWCNRTLTETGPDDRHVSFESCRRNRFCFEE
jgi:hypothetical protein